MSRIKVKEWTIYNGNLPHERMGKLSPPLGNAIIGRVQKIKEAAKSALIEEATVLKQIKDKLNESLLKMNSISKKQANLLFESTTVFPFDFFPDKITITASKIEVKICTFFSSYSAIAMPLQDIGFVELNKALFFSSLILHNIRSDKPIVLNYLWSGEAIRAKKIIDGLLIAQESGVDIALIETQKLLPQLEILGSTPKS